MTNYIPHHFALNPDKPGKFGEVYDATAKYKNISLNDQLDKGTRFAELFSFDFDEIQERK